MFIVKIALPIPLFKTFEYLLPIHLKPIIGVRVCVPWGKKNIIGIIIDFYKKNTKIVNKLKEINNILDNNTLFSSHLWYVLFWASDYYHYPIGKVLFHALPNLLQKGKKIKFITLKKWSITNKGYLISLDKFKNAPKQQQALKIIKYNSVYFHQINTLKLTKSSLYSLYDKGFINLEHQIFSQKTWYSNFSIKNKKHNLNNEQLIAINTIKNKNKEFIVWLLTGVIGSGKTEVYLNVVENILSEGKQVLILVPEINLIQKTISRFYKYFNIKIDILHSNLNHSEKLAIWFRIRYEEVAIIIGTRLSLFSPFKSLGIIILNEEHNNSYKQQKGWCYHTRDLAILRAKIEKIPIIINSSTPTLETLYNVKKGKYHQLTLNKYIKKFKPIIKNLISLKGVKLKFGLTPLLIQTIKKHLISNNQILLYLNKQGYSPALICHQCHCILRCKYCNHNYIFYKNQQYLKCFYCNNKQLIPYQCLNCQSIKLISIGIGIEQLEIGLKYLFSKIPIVRIDQDIIKNKNLLKEYLLKTYKNNSCIFISTKILIKNYDFPNITLIALINIDYILFSSNFRSEERFAQLYTQISGYISKKNKKREILLQTNYPEHPFLQNLLKKDYIFLTKKILKERKNVFLPPYTHHIIIYAEDNNNYQAIKFLQEIYNKFKINTLKDKLLWILDPIQSNFSKHKGYFCWQLLLQHPSRYILKQLIKKNLLWINILSKKQKIKWMLDVDPINN